MLSEKTDIEKDTDGNFECSGTLNLNNKKMQLRLRMMGDEGDF